MKKFKLILAAAVLAVLAVAYFGSVFATMYLHNKFMGNVVGRFEHNRLGIKVTEHEIDSEGIFNITKNYVFKTKEGNIGFGVILSSNFWIPFQEVMQIQFTNLNGDSVKCANCDYSNFSVDGVAKIDYFSNTYEGQLEVPDFTTGKEQTVQILHGSVGISGAFADKTMNLDLNLGGVKFTDNTKNIRTNVERIDGKLALSVINDNLLIQTKDKGIGIAKLYDNDRSLSTKTEVNNLSVKIENKLNDGSVGPVDAKVTISARDILYDNENYDSEFNVGRVGTVLNIYSVDQQYLIELKKLYQALTDYLRVPNYHFDYNNFKYFADLNSRIEIDQLRVVSVQNSGKFEIVKGSAIRFNGKRQKDLKDQLDLFLDFKIVEQFIDDFPNHDKIKKMFITEHDWLVHGSMDSKDEYSTNLKIKEGQCSLGQNMLNDC